MSWNSVEIVELIGDTTSTITYSLDSSKRFVVELEQKENLSCITAKGKKIGLEKR